MDQARWEYFRTIEDDLAAAARYVEFCEDNYGCHSVHFARVILAAGSEVDSVAKALCRRIDPSSRADNILKYHGVISSRYSRMGEVRVTVPSRRLELRPWAGWTSAASADWWRNGFTAIKHDRTDSFRAANLRNALLSTSALLALLLYHMREVGGRMAEIGMFEAPRLLDVPDESCGDGGGGVVWGYGLPCEPWSGRDRDDQRHW